MFIDLCLPSKSLRGLFKMYQAIAVYNRPEGSLGERPWRATADIPAISPHTAPWVSDDVVSGRLDPLKNQGQLVTGFLTTTYTET